jgi:ABC-type transport system involved in multi-copper enzyme maturation permease subunit
MPFLSPIFWADLRQVSRRGRNVFIRMAYVLILVTLLYSAYQEAFSSGSHLFAPGVLRFYSAYERKTELEQMREAFRIFSEAFSTSFIIGQFGVLLLVTPAYLAGAISEDRQRGNLEFYLTTDLTCWDIIFGKYLSRVLVLGQFFLAGLPVLMISQLFGGLPFSLILALLMATVGMLCSVAALSIWLSIRCRSSYMALILSYLVMIALSLLWWLLFRSSVYAAKASDPLASALLFANPIVALKGLLSSWQIQGELGWLPFQFFGITTLIHLAIAFLFLVMGTSSFRQEQTRFARNYVSSVRYARRKRPVGDYPLIWKETQVGSGWSVCWAK